MKICDCAGLTRLQPALAHQPTQANILSGQRVPIDENRVIMNTNNFIRINVEMSFLALLAIFSQASAMGGELGGKSDTEGIWGKPSDGFQLAVTMAKTNYQAGEPVGVKVVLKNVDTQTHWVMALGGRPFYNLTAKDQNGKPVPLKPKQDIIGGGHYIDSSEWNPGASKREIRVGEKVGI